MLAKKVVDQESLVNPPIVRIFACCARAMTVHVATPPAKAMNSRRLTRILPTISSRGHQQRGALVQLVRGGRDESPTATMGRVKGSQELARLTGPRVTYIAAPALPVSSSTYVCPRSSFGGVLDALRAA